MEDKSTIGQESGKQTISKKSKIFKGLEIDLELMKQQRLSVAEELAIIEGIVYHEGDLKKVAKETNIDIKQISNIVYKYRSKIEEILDYAFTINERMLHDSIGMLVEIINGSLKTLLDMQRANPVRFNDNEKNMYRLKILSEQVIAISKQTGEKSQKAKDSLRDFHIKLKTIEVMESGKVEDMSAFIENQNIIGELFKPVNDTVYYNMSNAKPLIVIDDETKEKIRFESIKQAARAYKTTETYIRTVVRGMTKYKGRFYIMFEEDEPTFFERLKVKEDMKAAKNNSKPLKSDESQEQ
jgi:hypothetical protein